jgi:hypothetical protein
MPREPYSIGKRQSQEGDEEVHVQTKEGGGKNLLRSTTYRTYGEELRAESIDFDGGGELLAGETRGTMLRRGE